MAVVGLGCISPRLQCSFYTEKLGLRSVREEENYAVIDCGGVSLELIRSRLTHPQELQFEVEGIDSAVAELRSKGVEFEEIEIGMRQDGTFATSLIGETYWGRYAVLHDPEGNSVMLAEHDADWFPYMPGWFTEDAESHRQTNG